MILCCGEALIDMIPAHTNEHRKVFDPHPGGAIFNTAIALSRLNVDTELFTGLSTDLFGDQLREYLTTNEVGFRHSVVSDKLSTLAFVTLNNGSASYCFFDENSAGRMLNLDDLPNDVSDIEGVFFGGISLAVEPCADTYATFLKQSASHKFIMMDPNIRENFIENEDRYRKRMNTLVPCCDVIKVSDEDLNWLKPGQESISDKSLSLLNDGPDLVFLTRGRDGAVAYTKSGHIVSIPGKDVEVVDTVGAGDTFNAAVLKGFKSLGCLKKGSIKSLHKNDIEKVLTLAIEASANSVTKSGANPPWARELKTVF